VCLLTRGAVTRHTCRETGGRRKKRKKREEEEKDRKNKKKEKIYLPICLKWIPA
jgi:hypothetical protein